MERRIFKDRRTSKHKKQKNDRRKNPLGHRLEDISSLNLHRLFVYGLSFILMAFAVFGVLDFLENPPSFILSEEVKK